MSVLMPQSSSLVACGVSADVNQNWSSKRQQGKPVLCHCGSLSVWNKSIWNTGISFYSVLGCSFLFVFSLVKAVNEFQEGSFSYIVFFFFLWIVMAPFILSCSSTWYIQPQSAGVGKAGRTRTSDLEIVSWFHFFFVLFVWLIFFLN